jgi:hypothetical protein
MEDVREKHGVVQEKANVTINERESCIALTTNGEYNGQTCFVTPNEARHLASRLYRLARRVESRLQ